MKKLKDCTSGQIRISVSVIQISTNYGADSVSVEELYALRSAKTDAAQKIAHLDVEVSELRMTTETAKVRFFLHLLRTPDHFVCNADDARFLLSLTRKGAFKLWKALVLKLSL